MLNTILNRLISESLPITSLEIWDNSTPTGNQTLHSWNGRTVLADWSAPATIANIHRLEQALLGRIWSFSEYFDGLDQTGKNNIIKMIAEQLLLTNPSFGINFGLPTTIPPIPESPFEPIPDTVANEDII